MLYLFIYFVARASAEVTPPHYLFIYLAARCRILKSIYLFPTPALLCLGLYLFIVSIGEGDDSVESFIHLAATVTSAWPRLFIYLVHWTAEATTIHSFYSASAMIAGVIYLF